MKYICIKTNNSKIINYLQNAINKLKFENIYFSISQFKLYTNVIIHYNTDDFNKIIYEFSHILSNLILDICEEIILKHIITHEYGYFDSIDRAKILDFIYDLQSDDDYSVKFDLLYDNFYLHLLNNNKLFLDGFIPFRVKDYLQILTENVDSAVNKFLIEREYSEFISILRLYISSQNPTKDVIHLIYNQNQAILLDKNQQIIEEKSLSFNAKYLSDITFSANDYTLNSLLSIVPQKIYIHLINSDVDEFIDTLKLIFENRVVICHDCHICKKYNKSKNSNDSATSSV